ncbi:hypothetical protein VKT23_001984 [Stygiomarasmius scandens]|uniref:Heterokaryon incompatibility domain-containing protein n=1 Tax=Marasmiellus scandens TaxID=2682957 RepID=A0ABR1K367_9AGAR
MPQISLTMPPRPEFIPFTISNLCEWSLYDGEDFWTCPERCGWVVHAKDMQCHVLCPPGACHNHHKGMSGTEIVQDKEKSRVRPPMLSRSDGKPVIASEKVIFLQRWLFFGFLMEVSNLCGLEIDLGAEFIVGNGLLSTARLNDLPRRWFEAAFKAHRVGDKMIMERILTTARLSKLLLSEELIDEDMPMFRYTYAECLVLHSLDILVRITGLHLLLHVYMPGFIATEEEGWNQQRIMKSLDWNTPGREGMNQLYKFALDDLKSQGWCKSELRLTPNEAVFARLISRPRIRDHSCCGDVICDAYQTDEATYRTRHVDDECSCDFLGVETAVLVAALSKDKVPKLVVTEDLGFRVVSEHKYPYIAFSHTWADGLGNAMSNALPRCQIRRLRDYVHHLSGMHAPMSTSPESSPVAFWMDTLCIPVDPSARTYRKKAIRLLEMTFQEATVVLVLDRELEIVESSAASFLELGLRILCSGWAKRLWTLQEAALASEAQGALVKLYFQMQDGPFRYQMYDGDRKALQGPNERTSQVLAEERPLLLELSVMLRLGAQIPSPRAMRNVIEGWSPFRVIYHAIEYRSTSKSEDVPVCIASLLGKDLSTIVSASDGEQGMANFYMLMCEVPIGVLWSERPVKLTIRPFRWAPRSITDCPETAYMGWENGICDAVGLHIKAEGFIFTEREIEIGAMLPRVFNIVSEDTQAVVRQMGRPPGYETQKQIPLEQELALIFRPVGGAGGRDLNTVVVAVEGTVGSASNHEAELLCRIVGYLHAFPPRGAQYTAFRGYLTAAKRRWCIT